MITAPRLELVRQDSHATAEALQHLVTQLNAQLDGLRKVLDALEQRVKALETP